MLPETSPITSPEISHKVSAQLCPKTPETSPIMSPETSLKVSLEDWRFKMLPETSPIKSPKSPGKFPETSPIMSPEMPMETSPKMSGDLSPKIFDKFYDIIPKKLTAQFLSEVNPYHYSYQHFTA